MVPCGYSLTGTISRSWWNFFWMPPLFAELFFDPAMIDYICKIFKISVTQCWICDHRAYLNILTHTHDQNLRIAGWLRGCATVLQNKMNMMIEWLIQMLRGGLWPSKTPNNSHEMMASLDLFNLITSHLEKGYAFGVSQLLHHCSLIDLALCENGIGFSVHHHTLRTNAKEHSEHPLSHTHI